MKEKVLTILHFDTCSCVCLVEGGNGVPPPEKMEFGKEVKEDLNSNPEDDPTHFIAILVESLYMLRKIPEAAEVMTSCSY